MRLTPWRALRPKDANSGLDKERLEERLAKLVGGPVAGATPVPAPAVEAIVPDPGKPAEVGAVLDAVALPVKSQKRGDDGDTATSERNRRRRRKAGFLLFFAGLIAVSLWCAPFPLTGKSVRSGSTPAAAPAIRKRACTSRMIRTLPSGCWSQRSTFRHGSLRRDRSRLRSPSPWGRPRPQ